MLSYQNVPDLMLALFAISTAYPWDMTWPGAKWLAHLPLLQIPLWYLYEMAMPEGMNIRVDLLWIVPGLLVAALMYFAKLTFLLFVENQELRNTQKPPARETAGGAKDT